MDLEERVARVVRNAEEVLTPEEVRALFERTESPRAYIGFEPSGALTIAHLITARKILDLAEAGCDVTVFFADWHAWINDKLGGDLERIRASGRYMGTAFRALGAGTDRVRFRFASELTGSSEYWARVVRSAKATTLARTKRAMSIMGRTEEESNLDSSRLFYPAMQVADIFELPVEIAYGGMDQRRAHVLAREVAHHYGWPVPTAVHTPLLSSLKGGGRMNPAEGVIEGKMSKSDPTSGVPIPAERAEIEARIAQAFCPPKEVEGNPVVEVVRFIAFPWEGRLDLPRAPKHGGPLTFDTEQAFLEAWRSGGIHPADLKAAVVAMLERRLAPAREYFLRHPEEGPGAFLAPAPRGAT
ncbi:MAG TPA: tyrosine--tRNA ligase [Thermoplasmata archaeon]|nr:tyrosine--tRNA ligase [Thermoplasmata archaeon]